MGEGGALAFPDDGVKDAAEILREKGTNRSQFFRGQIDKYRWVDYGSSYLPSDMNAAYLWAQLEEADIIREDRLASFGHYQEGLRPLVDKGYIEQPFIPDYAEHNAHMYYIKVKDLETRTRLISYLKEQEVQAVFHYVPLHSAPAGRKFGYFHGEDRYTTKESERILRLPMYYRLKQEDRERIIERVTAFFEA